MIVYCFTGEKLGQRVFHISTEAEQFYRYAMGFPIIEADIYMWIYAAFNQLSIDHPDISSRETLKMITDEDVEKVMYSELELYDIEEMVRLRRQAKKQMVE